MTANVLSCRPVRADYRSSRSRPVEILHLLQ